MHSPGIGYHFAIFDIHIIQTSNLFSRRRPCSIYSITDIVGFPFVKDSKAYVAEQSTKAAVLKILIALFVTFRSVFYTHDQNTKNFEKFRDYLFHQATWKTEPMST